MATSVWMACALTDAVQKSHRELDIIVLMSRVVSLVPGQAIPGQIRISKYLVYGISKSGTHSRAHTHTHTLEQVTF